MNIENFNNPLFCRHFQEYLLNTFNIECGIRLSEIRDLKIDRFTFLHTLVICLLIKIDYELERKKSIYANEKLQQLFF
jgi:integrase